jgi:hypothetical protein
MTEAELKAKLDAAKAALDAARDAADAAKAAFDAAADAAKAADEAAAMAGWHAWTVENRASDLYDLVVAARDDAHRAWQAAEAEYQNHCRSKTQ